MPRAQRALAYTGGVVSGPTERNAPAPGVPDMLNMRLTPDGRALTPFPGYRRVSPVPLMPVAEQSPQGRLRVVRFPPEYLRQKGGHGLGIVDEVNGRVVALGYHPGGPVIDPETDPDPEPIGTLNRVGVHDYPTILNFQGKTFIGWAHDNLKIYDGVRLRDAGIRGPVLSPTVSVAPIPANIGIAMTGVGESWVVADDPENPGNPLSTVTLDDSGQGVTIKMSSDQRKKPGSLAYHVLADPVVFQRGPTTEISHWINLSGFGLTSNTLSRLVGVTNFIRGTKEHDVFSATRDFGNRGIELVLDSTADFSGVGSQRIFLDYTFYGGYGRVSDNTYTRGIPLTGSGTFTAQTVGLVLVKEAPSIIFTPGEAAWLPLSAGLVKTVPLIIGAGTVETYFELFAAFFDRVRDTRFAFSWVDSEGAESSLSPFFPDVADSYLPYVLGSEINIDLAGVKDTALAAGDFFDYDNSPPTGGNRILSVNVYITVRGWAPVEGATQVRRLFSFEGIPERGEDGQRLLNFKGFRDMREVLSSPAPPPFSVLPPSGSLLLDAGQRMLIAGQSSYSLGRVQTDGNSFVIRKLLAYKWNAGGATQTGYFLTVIDAEQWFSDESIPEFDADTEPLGWQFDVTRTANFGDHLENRQIRIGTDETPYFIKKSLRSEIDATAQTTYDIGDAIPAGIQLINVLPDSDFSADNQWRAGLGGETPVPKWTIDTGAGTATFAGSDTPDPFTSADPTNGVELFNFGGTAPFLADRSPDTFISGGLGPPDAAYTLEIVIDSFADDGTPGVEPALRVTIGGFDGGNSSKRFTTAGTHRERINMGPDVWRGLTVFGEGLSDDNVVIVISSVRILVSLGGGGALSAGSAEKVLGWPSSTHDRLYILTGVNTPYDKTSKHARVSGDDFADDFDPREAGTSFEVFGHPSRISWTMKTASRGTQLEAVAITNFIDLEMPGDEIVSLTPLGELILVGGRKTMILLRQNENALDDVLSAAVFPRPRVLRGDPGMVSGRTSAAMPNSVSMHLSPEGQLIIVSPGGAQVHPISSRIVDWIRSNLRTHTNSLKRAHARFYPELNWYVLYLVDTPATPVRDGQFAEFDDTPPDERYFGLVE